jgi:hypothetical protein
MDLKAAVRLVSLGKTYSEAAHAIGLNRNQVAGACTRSGLRVGCDRAKSKASEQLRRQRRDPYFELKRLAALRAALQRRQAGSRSGGLEAVRVRAGT